MSEVIAKISVAIMDDQRIDSIAANGTNCFSIINWNDLAERSLIDYEQPQGPLRIGVVGAQGTGKTTLVEMLAESLGIQRIDEVARTVHRLGFGLDTNADLYSQTLMWLGQLYEETVHSEFVADRTLLDVVVYCDVLTKNQKLDHQQQIFKTTLFNLTFALFKQQYNAIFYIPIEFALADDGIRALDLDYQHEVDQCFLKWLDNFDINYKLLRGSRTQRLNDALKLLGR